MTLRRDDVSEGQTWRHVETRVPGYIVEFDRDHVTVDLGGPVEQVSVDWLLENCELMP